MSVPSKEQILKWAKAAAKEWKEELATEEKVREQVRRRLEYRFDKLVAQAIGFEARWSEWEIRYERNGDRTSIADMIDGSAQGVVEELISGDIPALSEKDRKAARAAYLKGLQDRLREVAYEKGQAAAADLMEAILAGESGLKVDPE